LTATLLVQSQFIHEERLCLPVGAVAGAITGFLNERWRDGGGGGGGSAGSDKEHGRPGLSGFGSESNPVHARRPYSDADDNNIDDGDFDPFQSSGLGPSGAAGKRY
jgi:hypothetical protein